MKNLILAGCLLCFYMIGPGCNRGTSNKHADQKAAAEMKTYLQNYYNDRMKLFPLEATANGDYRYNNLLPIDISESYREKVRMFYQDYLDQLNKFDRASLSEEDQISYDILIWELQNGIDGLKFPDHLIPINQFWSLPLTFAQLGSGQSNQPFSNVRDYESFLSRAAAFPIWCDTAIANMKRGIAAGITLPDVLVKKVLSQMQDLVATDVHESVFYMPVKNFPESVTPAERHWLDSVYTKTIKEQIIPSYKKLHDFMQDEYLAASRKTIGISEVPGGRERYDFLIKYWTTTTLSADSIFNLGMSEVQRLRAEMEKVKDETGYKGDLKSFFTYLNTDKKFFPFKSEREVLDAYNAIYHKMEPQLDKMFDIRPRGKFEVRQTEKFREASSSAEYNPGTADGSRPGIFYVPIPDPKKFNTFAMEDLFLHEAIPGHHFQNMLTIENDSLPMFRRFIWYGAYGEGWALYAESLGKELGLYTDPYQYFAALSEEMHRAIRLVVDVGMHTRGWTREQAIQFSLDNEGEDEAAIVSEIERYIAIPGQALAYKIGQLEILDLRKKAMKELDSKFDIRSFHNEILNDGCLPLDVLDTKMNRWMKGQMMN